MQANEVLKKILKVGQNLNGFILIIDLLNLSFRKVKLNKTKKVKIKNLINNIFNILLLISKFLTSSNAEKYLFLLKKIR